MSRTVESLEMKNQMSYKELLRENDKKIPTNKINWIKAHKLREAGKFFIAILVCILGQ